MAKDHDTLIGEARAAARMLRTRMTRRRMLEASALGAATALVAGNVREARAASADSHGPGWYSDDKLEGKVVCYTFSGQRWGLAPRAVVPTFKERFPNVELQIIDEPLGEGYTKIQMRAASKASTFNCAIADSNQWTALGNIGAMESFEPMLAADPGWAEDYFNDVPEIITSGYKLPQNPGGDTYGLSCDGNCKLHYYRKDLFEEAGITKVPETWEEAIETAKALHRPDRDQYGFVTTARRGLFAGLELYQVMASLGGSWFDRMEEGGWNPQFHTDYGHEAFDILLRLMEYRHPVTLNAADDEVNAVLANGTAVFAPMEWGTSVLNNKDFTEFWEVFGTDIVPRGSNAEGRHIPLMGGFAFYVNVWGSDKDAAFEFVKHLNSGDYTDSRIGEAYVRNAGQPARLSLLTKYEDEQPYFSGLKKSFPHGTPGFPWVPEAITLADLVGNEVVAVINGEKSVGDALEAMDDGNRQVMQDSGYYG